MKDKHIYDVFHSYLVQNANYTGKIELPCIRTSNKLPHRVMNFSKAMSQSSNNFDYWITFYEDDRKFERLWNNPKLYINKLKQFCGIISPDFSVQRNMPLVMQQWNTYRSRALAFWLQSNGIEVIPNIRFNDERTYEFCFDGIEANKTVSLGTHGCIRNKTDRYYFKNGLYELVSRLTPKTIIVYGLAPDDIFYGYRLSGINILQFDCEHIQARKRVSV